MEGRVIQSFGGELGNRLRADERLHIVAGFEEQAYKAGTDKSRRSG